MAAGSPSPPTALVSLSLHLCFLLHTGQAPELLKETYSEPAAQQSRTHPTNMTRTWCYFPTQTFKKGRTDLSHGATPRPSVRLPGIVHATPPAVPQGRRPGEDGLQRQRQVLRRWQEVPSTPTLVTPCSGPSQTQQRLLVPPGPAPGLPLKVLPAQGRAVPVCQGSRHCSSPSRLLHGFCQRLAVLSPSGRSHGSACLALNTGGEMQAKKKNNNPTQKRSGLVLVFFSPLGLPLLPCQGQNLQTCSLILI